MPPFVDVADTWHAGGDGDSCWASSSTSEGLRYVPLEPLVRVRLAHLVERRERLNCRPGEFRVPEQVKSDAIHGGGIWIVRLAHRASPCHSGLPTMRVTIDAGGHADSDIFCGNAPRSDTGCFARAVWYLWRRSRRYLGAHLGAPSS